MSKTLAVSCVAMTITLTVYGQLVIKWRVSEAGAFPATVSERAKFLLGLVTDPWVISVWVAAACAALAWTAALTRFDLNAVYPFMSLTFVLVLILGAMFLDEAVTPARALGIALIVGGLIVGSQA
jgi:uncharacterized membrane protein